MKMQSRILLLIFCTTFSSSFYGISVDPTPYQAQAEEWINAYIYSLDKRLALSTADLALIANLIYFSFNRSLENLKAHESTQKTLRAVLQGYENISSTRMNPSLPLTHQVNFKEQTSTFKQFRDVQRSHRSVGSAYAHCAEYVVKENHIPGHSKKAVKQLRLNARTVVTQAVLDIKKILGSLYNFASNYSRIEQIDSDSDEQYRFDFMESLSAYIPSLALQSFIESEKINRQATEQTGQVLSTILDVTKQVWDAIEQARAAYYLAHYRALRQVMRTHNIDATQMYCMFDEHGMIPSNKYADILPEI